MNKLIHLVAISVGLAVLVACVPVTPPTPAAPGTTQTDTAQADATNIIRACVVGKNPSIPALTLAMECLEEAREVGFGRHHKPLRLCFPLF